MGLYINEDQQGMFRHSGEIDEPNQTYFRRDYLKEILIEQKQMYQTINHTMSKLAQTYENKELTRSKQLLAVNDRLDHMAHAVEVNGLTEQQLEEQINDMAESNQRMLQWMESYSSNARQLGEKIDQQITEQAKLTKEISGQREVQFKIVNRLENQEALTEKLLRQMDHFRSLLFERTHYLAEQIENGYQFMATYIYKQLTGVEQPLTLLMNELNKEHKVK